MIFRCRVCQRRWRQGCRPTPVPARIVCMRCWVDVVNLTRPPSNWVRGVSRRRAIQLIRQGKTWADLPGVVKR